MAAPRRYGCARLYNAFGVTGHWRHVLRFHQCYIGTEHLLLGLMKEGAGVAARVLNILGVDERNVRLECDKLVARGADPIALPSLPITPRAQKVLEYALEEATNLRCDHVRTEHLLLGLVRDDETVAVQVLLNLGVQPEKVRATIQAVLDESTRSQPPKPT